MLKTLVKGSDVYIYSSSECLGEGAKVQGGDPWNADSVQPHGACHLPVFAEHSWLYQSLLQSLPPSFTLWLAQWTGGEVSG